MISRRAFALTVPAMATLARALRAAGVDGKWEAEIEGPQGPAVFTFEFKADGEMLAGTISGGMGDPVEIQDGKISGDEIEFAQVMQRGNFEIRINYTGKISGDEMELTRTMQRPGGPGGGPGRGRGPGVGPGGGRPGGGRPGGAQGGQRPGGGQGGGRGGPGRALTFTAKRVM